MHFRVQAPFLFVTDAERRSLGFVALGGPLRCEEEVAAYLALSAHFRVVGFTSLVAFPEPEPWDTRDYLSLCEGWCHGLREPDRYIPVGIPRALISQSDFVDPEAYSLCEGEKDLDFVYVCGDGTWKEQVKNWSLAKRCLPLLCEQMGLRGALVGRAGVTDVPRVPRLEVHDFLPREEFYSLVRRAKFLFAPNVLDASPRVLAEALCMNTTIVVNRHILGGWKYVTEETGAFFESEDDLEAAVTSSLRPRDTRSWYSRRFGPSNAGPRLLRFLSSLGAPLPPATTATLSTVCRDCPDLSVSPASARIAG